MNREQFESILRSIFTPYLFFQVGDAILAILTNDAARIAWMRCTIDDLEAIIQGYLSQYDSAVDQAGRDAVIASVTNSYVCAEKPKASPDSYEWPSDGGGLVGGLLGG